MPLMNRFAAGRSFSGTAKFYTLSRLALFIIALLFILIAPTLLFPFSFEPIVQDFDPSGPGALHSFMLANPSRESIAIRIRMLDRRMEKNGSEINDSAEELFFVFPSQVVLAPDSVQTIKIQWKGPSDISVEQSYRILIEQVPVDFTNGKGKTGSLQIIFRYLGAAYILPENAKPEIILESSKPFRDPGGRRGLLLIFKNQGNTHALLGNLQISVNAKDPQATRNYSAEELVGIDGENILAGDSRHFFLPVPAEFQRDDTHVAFTFDPLR